MKFMKNALKLSIAIAMTLPFTGYSLADFKNQSPNQMQTFHECIQSTECLAEVVNNKNRFAAFIAGSQGEGQEPPCVASHECLSKLMSSFNTSIVTKMPQNN